ncbi:MAG: prepilin-type N-terminal cleavage/methylation domain-containing protein [Candidatus Omnitrophota bacterium]|nr:prepilin-type N-terminal cleavage/methylation domain-containing protein [Candidatus Omnitrophota bacterium]
MHPANSPLSARPTARWHPGFTPFDAFGHRTGFTLIELLIVVSLLILLATVGSIQLLRVRIITHEEIALTTTRHIAKSCHFFFSVNNQFPATLIQLGTAIPPYIQPDLVGNGTTVEKQGYVFTYARVGNGFTLNADPQTPNVTGIRHFFVNEQLSIHADGSDPADINDPVVP